VTRWYASANYPAALLKKKKEAWMVPSTKLISGCLWARAIERAVFVSEASHCLAICGLDIWKTTFGFQSPLLLSIPPHHHIIERDHSVPAFSSITVLFSRLSSLSLPVLTS
jgi:hypothetical protein